jgi:IS605 OrfB family transposase
MEKKPKKSENAHILVRKIKVVIVDDNRENKKKAYDYVKFCAKQMCQVANECSNTIYATFHEVNDIMKKQNVSKSQAIKILREKVGKSYENMIYQITKKYPLLSGGMRGSIALKLAKTYNENFYKIMNAQMSLPSYTKKTLPIPMEMSRCTLFKENDDIFLNLSTSKHVDIPRIKLKLLFGRDRSGNKIITEKIINGDILMSDGELSVDDNGELTYHLKYIQKIKTDETLNPNIIMGIDIGINYPVAIFIKGAKYQPRQIAAGLKIQHERMAINRRKQSILKSLKYNKGGHGRNKKISPKIILNNKEKNFSNYMNHQMSADLIKIAVENKCGIIKLENLKGITKHTKDYFLKSWSYFDLQQKIIYKAQLAGIKIQIVDPAYTSQMCPSCKTIDQDNRNKEDKTKFSCTNFLCIEHNKEKIADIIAAENIANKEPIPDKVLKKQELLD